MEEMKRCPFCAEEILAAAVKCKHCGSNLSDSAVAPPAAKRQTKTITAALAIVITLVAVSWIISANQPYKGPPDIPAPADPIADSTPPIVDPPAVVVERPVFKIDATEIYRQYDANEVATDEKIGNARVEISGTIDSIDKDFTGDVVIRLTTGDAFSTVGLTLEKSEKSKAISLTKGQEITIFCDHVQRILTSPRGSKCVIAPQPSRRRKS
jgi:hypothetical protein